MYTEGFEGLGEAEQHSRRTLVSHVSNDDADWLSLENERLKKALEKERFFNKLLDQEIQELKSRSGEQDKLHSDYWYGSKGVSKTTFYLLLIIALGLAGYVGFSWYNDRSDAPPPVTGTTSLPADNSVSEFSTPPVNAPVAEPLAPEEEQQIQEAVSDVEPIRPAERPPVKDSVPNIIARAKIDPIKKDEPPVKTETPKEINVEKTRTNTLAGPVDTRPVINRYRITSKANFYNSPDENSLKNIFIPKGEDKVVGSLEEKGDFIYVVYTNDLGYMAKGWLSKKDLTKME